MNMSGIGIGNSSQAAKANIRVSSSVPFGSSANNRSLLNAQDSFHRSPVQFGGKEEDDKKKAARKREQEEDARVKAEAEAAVAYNLMRFVVRNEYRRIVTPGMTPAAKQELYDRLKDIHSVGRTGSPPPQ